MKYESLFKKSLLAASIGLVTACSSGGSGGSAGTTEGVVTGFGSIFVNGVEYETGGASVEIDGTADVETSLGVGDVVKIQGSVNADGTTGVATSVTCADELEGYVLDVSGLDALTGTGTIIVMGMTVTVTADTVFNSNTAHTAVTDLVANDIVEVSGFSNGSGTVLATRIETKNAAEDVEVKGVVSALDSAANTFRIGSLTIDYASAIEVAAGLADGLYVEVKAAGIPTGDVASGFSMAASKVEIEDDGDIEVDGESGDDYEVQGLVSDVVPGVSFRFNGALVELATLELDDDFNPATLVDGMMITAEGYIDANGNFVVKEIEEEHGSEANAVGTVSATTATSVTITLADTSSMTFEVSNDTRMIDERDQGVVPLHYFGMTDVGIGDYVKIEYYLDAATGSNRAVELTRDDNPLP